MTIPLPNAEFPFLSHYQPSHGHNIHYLDQGSGDPILMLHGNPSWTYGWRHIIPGLAESGRVIAADNIGMGRSDKPDIDYSFFDHLKYLEGFVEALDLTDVTLLAHDWGTALGLSLLKHQRKRFRRIALMDPFFLKLTIGPMGEGLNSDPSTLSWHPEIMQLCLEIIDPVVGPRVIFEDDAFNRRGVPLQIKRELSDEELEAYCAPYKEPGTRKAQMAWPGQAISPSTDMINEFQYATEFLTSDRRLPKLLLYADESLVGPSEAQWFEQNVPNSTTACVGEGYHYFFEDQPQEIVKKFTRWINSTS